MAMTFPYTQYACPCSELSNVPALLNRRKSTYQPTANDDLEDGTFDPHDPRANFSLYPLDNLLYCDECDAIRCPRCWLEEVITWYCPSCLFEVPSSAVKSEGNRCGRNCYNCPSCTSILQVTAVSSSRDQGGHLKPPSASPDDASYILQCQYCEWTSLDVGIQLPKATKLTEQLARLRHARSVKIKEQDTSGSEKEPSEKIPLDHDGLFSSLSNFYKDQLSETSDPQNPYSNSPYSSPANLARIMSIYGGLSYNALKKSREKPQPMREAGNQVEGLLTYNLDGPDEDDEVLRKMEQLGWNSTTTQEQRQAAPVNFDAKTTDQLWPTATALRTRRGKRCKDCRQILIRPDSKVSSTRYRIRLLAFNFTPRLLLRPLNPSKIFRNPSFQLRGEDITDTALKPHIAQQYILTVRNPIFETIKVTLGTPTTTPGKVASRVTILCPSFTVGPAGDVWEEALGSSTSAPNDGSRKAAMASLTGSTDSDRQPEAGKIWEKTRNSTSVILEVVPGSLEPQLSVIPKSDEQVAEEALGDDDAILEIPIYVRVEWEAHPEAAKVAGDTAKESAGKVAKELGYWCVLGIGRIA